MNKDIIYIDTEDDITAIIGKIKASSEKVIALVPPKRTGVLQSAVNLRLLSRMAGKNSKSLVLVTNNKALIALSASAKIPYAKNLQSKPEIAEIAALEIDDGEDVIDGAQLPIGELAKTADYKPGEDLSDDISTIDIDNEGPQYVPALSKESTKPQPIKKAVKSNVKIPNFTKFRKRFFAGITVAILLIVFLVWAIWFAPSARIIITAKTETAPVSMTLNLGGSAATDINKNIIQTVTKQIKKDVSIDFTATGSKTIGTSAKGNIVFKNCETFTSQTIASGTVLTANGISYTTQSTVTVPAGSGSFLSCTTPGVSTPVQIIASDIGSGYNTANGTTFSVANHTDNEDVYFRGVATTDITGGESHLATVVTVADLQKAKQALVDLSNSDVKKQLTSEFTNGEVVITDSFNANHAAAVSVPDVDAEAVGGKAKLTSATTFTIIAVAKSELEEFLKDAITKQMDNSKNQRIYEDGIKSVKLLDYQNNDLSTTVNLSATGKIGPDIDIEAVKNQVKGKRFGDVQSLLEGIKGVEDVDTKFSYFWVNTVPNDINKIEVEFVLSNA